jgi:hypothetical protein
VIEHLGDFSPRLASHSYALPTEVGAARPRGHAPARAHVGGYRLLDLLGVKPNEAETIKVVSKQLEELELYDLVKTDDRDWQWIA